MNPVVATDRQLRAAIERRIVACSDVDRAQPMHLASTYFRIRTRVLRWLTRHRRWNGDGLTVTMALALQPGDTFLDIGANVGTVTALASHLVGARGRVHSFEPSFSTVRYLRRRVSMLELHNVEVNECGLGDAAGTAELHEFDENFGGASSLRSGAWPGHQQARKTTVVIEALDDYLARHDVGAVRLLKADVQGAEIEVLRGAKRLLSSSVPPALVVEVERDAQAAFGRDTEALLSTISSAGYETLSWRVDGLHEVRSDHDLPEAGHDDVICLKPCVHDVLKGQLVALARCHPATGVSK